jgi:hypothetical protein
MPDSGQDIEALQQRLEGEMQKTMALWQQKTEGGGPGGGAAPPQPPAMEGTSPAPDKSVMLSERAREDMLKPPTRLPIGEIADAPPEAMRLVAAAMNTGASPQDLIILLRSSGFVIRRIEQSPSLV